MFYFTSYDPSAENLCSNLRVNLFNISSWFVTVIQAEIISSAIDIFTFQDMTGEGIVVNIVVVVVGKNCSFNRLPSYLGVNVGKWFI